MDSDTALLRLIDLADSGSDPVLGDDLLATIVADAARADAAGNSPLNISTAPTWAAATTYAFGDVITADPAAGRWWRCVIPGASAATQPSWPDQGGASPGVALVTDNDVTWEDAGTAWTGTYDLNAAAAEAWRIKAAKAAGRFDFQTDGQTFRRGQIVANCHRMERMFRRKVSSVVH